MTTTETILKETDASGVYYRRTLTSETGTLLSDERLKKDPVLAFTQPPPAVLDDVTITATVTVSLQLQDFDGEARTDSGVAQFRMRDRAIADDEGVPFTRQLVNGQLALVMEFDAPGDYVITVEPPLLADLQLAEPIRVRVS